MNAVCSLYCPACKRHGHALEAHSSQAQAFDLACQAEARGDMGEAAAWIGVLAAISWRLRREASA